MGGICGIAFLLRKHGWACQWLLVVIMDEYLRQFKSSSRTVKPGVQTINHPWHGAEKYESPLLVLEALSSHGSTSDCTALDLPPGLLQYARPLPLKRGIKPYAHPKASFSPPSSRIASHVSPNSKFQGLALRIIALRIKCRMRMFVAC